MRREHVRDDGQGGWHDERSAYAHQRSRENEFVGSSGQGSQQRPEPKNDQPKLQRLASAELVAHGASGQEQPSKNNRVRINNPLQLTIRCL